MRKRRFLLSCLLIPVLLLSACTNGAGKGLPDEPYEAVEYRLYPAPEGGYVGDVMPFVTGDGELELYYLYDTDHNGQGYHPIYKYSTANLYDYRDHGMVLEYGPMSAPDPAIGTGSVLQDADGLFHLFYTGHNDTGNGGQGKECVMHAVSTDRENWVKDAEPLFFAPEGCSKDDFRDPEVFWVEEEQCYWMLIAAHDSVRGGIVARYVSEDLKNWEYTGPFYAPMDPYMCECPDLFCIGDTWYLTYSWDCVTYYAMSDSMNGPFAAPRDNILDGKSTAGGPGFIFYAAKPAQLDGRVYLCGWIGRPGLSADSGMYQWAGNVLVHQLVQRGDGTLGAKAPDTFVEYFTVSRPLRAARIRGKAKISGNSIALSAKADDYALADLGTRPATMTLECDVKLDEAGCAGFAFGGSETDGTWTVLCLDAAQGLVHYEGTEITKIRDFDAEAFTKFDFSRADTHHVKLVCENEIVVCYIDDEKALSSRIFHSIDGLHIGLFADGCDAGFENIRMKLPE